MKTSNTYNKYCLSNQPTVQTGQQFTDRTKKAKPNKQPKYIKFDVFTD